MVELRVWSWIKSYAHSDDPLVSASNTIALVVVGNQPFYPLYVWWFVGDDHWVSFLTFLSTPFFGVVPALARRSSVAGRALLPLAGIGNCVLSAWAFGEASGVEAFIAPCIVIAALSFRKTELRWMLGIIATATSAFLGLHGRYGAPLHRFSDSEYDAFRSMNFISVTMLTALVAYRFAGARQTSQ